MNDTKTTGGFEMVPDLKHHKFMVCGGPMSVYEAGDPKRPKIVMLHGAMYDESRFIWDQMFPYLSSNYHIFAVDTPRHGSARPWEGILNRSRLMNILDATFSYLGLDSFSMVGLSMGGGLSIEYAALYPDKVRSMALFEPGGLGDKVDKQFITWLYIKTPGMLRLLSKKYIKADHPAIRKLLDSLYVGGTKPTDPDRLVSLLEDEIKGKYNFGENDMDDWQLSSIGPFKLKWNILDKVALIQCPTLWLRGADSVLVKQHEMERAVHLAKGNGTDAILEVIQNAGHLLPLEQPELANVAVKQFFGKIIRK